MSSPTVSFISILLNLFLAVQERKAITIVDISCAHLNATMNDEVYMWLNKDISELFISKYPEYRSSLKGNGKILVRLNKALYGLKQSAKL